MKEKIFSILKLIFSLFCFFFIGTIVSYILLFLNVDLVNITIKDQVFIQFMLSILMFSIFFIVYSSDLIKDFKSFKKDISKNIKFIIKMFLLFLIVKYLVGILSSILMSIFNFKIENLVSTNQVAVEEYIKNGPILMFISSVLFAPFYEETLFRLGIRKVFNYGLFFVILSGMSFGLMHIFPLDEGISLGLGIIQSISYVTMGIFLAYVYNKSKNIYCSIGVHLLNNLFSILAIMNLF